MVVALGGVAVALGGVAVACDADQSQPTLCSTHYSCIF